MSILDDISSGISGLSNFFGGTDANAVNGVRPTQDLNVLSKIGLGLQGNQAVQNYQQGYNLQKLGSDLASGNIDQSQYLKNIAQYSPDTYNKIVTAQIQGTPAAVKINNSIQQLRQAALEAYNNGDQAKAQDLIDQANTIIGTARADAYGTKPYALPNSGGQVPSNNAVTTSNIPALPGSNVAPTNETSNNTPVTPITDEPKGNSDGSVIPPQPIQKPGEPTKMYKARLDAWKSDPIVQQATEAAKEQGKLNVKTGGEANSADETFNKLSQNLDAMTALVKQGGVPSSKYFASAGLQASLGQNIPQLGMQNTADKYTDFDSLNAPVVLNTLSELTKGGAIRGNQTIERIINQGFMVDPNLSDKQKLDKIATIKTELQNAAIASRNIANKDKGGPPQPYQAIPTVAASSENIVPSSNDANIIQQATGKNPGIKFLGFK